MSQVGLQTNKYLIITDDKGLQQKLTSLEQLIYTEKKTTWGREVEMLYRIRNFTVSS